MMARGLGGVVVEGDGVLKVPRGHGCFGEADVEGINFAIACDFHYVSHPALVWIRKT